MAMFRVIKSKQRAACYSCEQVKPIYGVQRVLTWGPADITTIPQADGGTIVELSGKPTISYAPTCKPCLQRLRRHLKRLAEEEQEAEPHEPEKSMDV